MKNRIFIILLSVIFLTSVTGCGRENSSSGKESNISLKRQEGTMENQEEEKEKEKKEPSYVEGELLLKFNSNIDKSKHKEIIKSYNCSIKNIIEKLNVYRLEIPEDKKVSEMVKILDKDERVEYAEPNVIYKVQE